MSTLLLVPLIAIALYVLFVLALFLVGSRESARALAGFVPDCVVLFSRLAGHPCVPRRRAIILGALLLYLASPIDLIPDFIPVVGYLDDAILVGIVLRMVIRDCSSETLTALWPGPPASLQVLLRLAGSADRPGA